MAGPGRPALDRVLIMDGIFFDLDNTLIDRGQAFEGYLVNLAHRFPATFGEQGPRDLMRELDAAGYRKRPEFCDLAVQAFDSVWSTPAEVWHDFASGLTRAVAERPAVIALVQRLATRYTLAVVTNGSRERQREKLRRAGLERLFETVLISEEVGAEKPEREIFERALAAVGVEAGDTLFVGDDPVRDIAGASAVGLRTCWVSHGRSFSGSFLAGSPAPDVTVTTVEELDRVLADGGLAD